MNSDEKENYLIKMDINTLINEVIYPLFLSMGFNFVQEKFPTDILLFKLNEFEIKEFTSVEIKKGIIEENLKNLKPVPGIDRHLIIYLSNKEIDSRKFINIENRIQLINISKLIDLIEKYLPSFYWEFDDFLNKYSLSLIKEFDISQSLGSSKSLQEIYVPLKGYELKNENNGTDDLDNVVIDLEYSLKYYDQILIIGEPGSGKSTFLKYQAIKLSKQNLENSENVSIPVFIKLRDFNNLSLNLLKMIKFSFSKYNFKNFEGMLETHLVNGNCYILLDGLDEIINEEKRKEIIFLIKEFKELYPRNKIVISSREFISKDSLDDFYQVKIRGFDKIQIEILIKNILESNFEKITPLFTEFISNYDNTKTIFINPLMISLLIKIYQTEGKFILKKSELYGLIIDRVLKLWDVQKRLENKYSLETKKSILKKIAYFLHSKRNLIMSFQEIEKLLIQSNELVDSTLDLSELLEETCKRSGLLEKIEKDHYQFSHLSFQEYFTALYLVEISGNEVIASNLIDPWWDNVFILYNNLVGDSSKLIQLIQEIPEDIFYNNLIYSGRAIIESENTPLELKNQIVNKLWKLYKNTDFKVLKDRSINIIAFFKPKFIIDESIKHLKVYGNTRDDAAVILWKLEAEEAIEPLNYILSTSQNDRHITRISYSLAHILLKTGKIEKFKEIFIEHESDDAKSSGIHALQKVGTLEALNLIITHFASNTSPVVREKSLYTLKKFNNEIVENKILDMFLNDPDLKVRSSAAIHLGLMGSEKAVKPFIKTMNSSAEENLKDSVAHALGCLKSKEATNILIDYVQKNFKSYSVIDYAARALGKIGTDKAKEFLIKLFLNNESLYKDRIILALADIKSEDVTDLLIDILRNDKNPELRDDAAYALGKIGSKKATSFLLEILGIEKNIKVLKNIIYSIGETKNFEAIEPLKLIFENNIALRVNVINALDRIGTDEIIPLILNAFGSDDKFLRISAVKACRKINDSNLNKVLINLLSDQDNDIRGWAILILGEHGEESSIKQLIKLLKDDSRTDVDYKKIQELAFNALEQISKKSLKRIII